MYAWSKLHCQVLKHHQNVEMRLEFELICKSTLWFALIIFMTLIFHLPNFFFKFLIRVSRQVGVVFLNEVYKSNLRGRARAKDKNYTINHNT